MAAMAQEIGMFTVAHTVGSVLCCKCGILMQPNATNMCLKCLRTEVDITEGLQKRVEIAHCPDCDSYLQPPITWIKAELESKKLLTFCLNNLNGLKKVRLVHAEFIWTEPHSKRIKVKLTVQKEVLNGAILEQACIVEYSVHEKMCDSCSRIQANPDQWECVVQLRQHVPHRRTFFYLEQLILKHDAAKHAIRIKQMKQGIDFFFKNHNHGDKFVDFLGKVALINVDKGKRLISHDTKSNKHVFKYSLSVEISPICREDLICLPPEVAVGLGNLGPLVICNKVSNNLALFDPFTFRQSFLNKDQYWSSSFKALLSSKQLVEYIVLDVEAVSREVDVRGVKYVLADAQVARVSDFGKNDMIFNVRTHLGRILKAGDYALGYDLYGANINDIELDKYNGLVLPDVILIKKSYEKKMIQKCSWKLRSLDMEIDNAAEGGDNEYELFLRDLEENPGSVFNLSLEIQPSENMASGINGGDICLTLADEFEDLLDLGDEEGHADIMKE
ncbi:hypothetical protein DH2020_008367 [Rehmannia glutinosa]|uniref:60S ribosomal export protein NMD3 n=1 Tax=Rehmannia glutinosa TaxID=99300 RepID=A0ABR0U0T6_REHGL